MELKLLLQILGVVLGLLYLWLEYKANIWLWIVGIIMPTIHSCLYYISGLYADCGMQFYYILAGIYGLIAWLIHAKRESNNQIKIEFAPQNLFLPLFGIYIVLHIGIFCLLFFYTDSTVPFWDAMTTALSVVGLWLLSRRYVEQWLVWIVVDVITFGLYLYKDIPLTSLLYLLYTCLAFVGYRKWYIEAKR